jgi:lysophospholipase L1-like esterase
MKIDKKGVVFGLVLVGLVVLFLEGTLGALARVSPRLRGLLASPWTTYSIPDARLGHRPNPEFPGHDANGFRNPRVPQSADVVALGDSQTYGTGVEAAQAWPGQLGALTGRSVYNMSFGGYGPAHGLLYWDGAAALGPRVVLEAVYSGNDFFDCFDLVYGRGQLPELKSPEPAVQERVREAERVEPLAEHVARMFVMDSDTPPAEQGWTAATEGFSPAKWIAHHSNLYGLARRARYEWSRRRAPARDGTKDSWESALAFARAHPGFCQPFDGGASRTVFTSTYRLSAIDQSDPRIQEGLRILLRALGRAHARAAESHVRFIVLLIPTKEAVFEEIYRDPPESYRRLMENEALARRTMTEFLDANGIEYVDALPALRAQFAAGPQPYHWNHDGHPNEHGHRAIAEAVARRLASE